MPNTLVSNHAVGPPPTTFEQALSTLVQASMLNSVDAGKLTALVQSSSQPEDADDESGVGAPDAAVYKGLSGGIIETLESSRDKAEKKNWAPLARPRLQTSTSSSCSNNLLRMRSE